MTDFLSFAKQRYSVRSYASKPVEEEKIRAMLEAAAAAPTACNNQPQLVIAAKSELALTKLAACSPCTFHAPVVFIIGYDDRLSAKGKVYDGYQFGETDASIVCTHMMLEAADLGLGTCWVGWFNEQEVKQALRLPEHMRVCALLPTGYPAEGCRPADAHTKSREIKDFYSEI